MLSIHSICQVLLLCTEHTQGEVMVNHQGVLMEARHLYLGKCRKTTKATSSQYQSFIGNLLLHFQYEPTIHHSYILPHLTASVATFLLTPWWSGIQHITSEWVGLIKASLWLSLTQGNYHIWAAYQGQAWAGLGLQSRPLSVPQLCPCMCTNYLCTGQVLMYMQCTHNVCVHTSCTRAYIMYLCTHNVLVHKWCFVQYINSTHILHSPSVYHK